MVERRYYKCNEGDGNMIEFNNHVNITSKLNIGGTLSVGGDLNVSGNTTYSLKEWNKASFWHEYKRI